MFKNIIYFSKKCPIIHLNITLYHQYNSLIQFLLFSPMTMKIGLILKIMLILILVEFLIGAKMLASLASCVQALVQHKRPPAFYSYTTCARMLSHDYFSSSFRISNSIRY